MRRTRADRRATPIIWISTLVAPMVLIAAAVSSSRTHSFVGGMLLGICIALAVASGVVLALVGAGSAYARDIPADDDVLARPDAAHTADLAVLDELEPLRADRPGDHR